jgi:predicted permease
MARLRSDVPVATAEAALSVLWSQLREYSIQARGVQRYHLEFRSGEQGLGGLQNQFSKPLWLLMAIAGVVALIVCSNLASLLLARASSRVHEMGVRLALGAGRGRLLRQLLTESLILAGLGGILGLALAWVAARALVEMASMGETWHLAMEMNWRVVGFTALASVTSALVFGLAPALIGTRLGLRTALETSQRSHSGGRSRATAVRFFLAGQIALSMMLVAGSFLLVRSFWNVAHQDFGYQPEGVLMARLTVDDGNVRQLFAVETHEAVYRRLRSIPGVQFSGLTGAGLLDTGIGIGGSDLATPERNVPQSAGTRWLAVSPGYTEAMQIPILKGRALNDADRRGSARVTVISETVARLLFGKSDPIGQRFSMGKIYEPQKALEVVGVMRDVRFATPREPLGPLMFLPLGQAPLATSPTVILRTAGDPTAFVEPLRKAVREAAPGLKIDKVDTLRATIQVHARRERLLAWLSGAFGGLALVLAAMGLYGVIAYTAELRTKEMGIRLALGADRSHVRWLLLRSILSLLGLGVVVGTGVAIGMGRFMESLLFELAPNDPATLVAAAGVLCAVGMLAGYLPARRAVKLDPMMALRED